MEAGGDVDTTAAIVGGIVAAHTGVGNRDASHCPDGCPGVSGLGRSSGRRSGPRSGGRRRWRRGRW
ncbi:hypothetical protein [Nocardia sp. NPDC058633]|uniref:hypothetical protein n=1 Tax=Nocardia sp. NPDC058633 TaxID=3346568 RepID=UPI00365A030E